MYVSIIYYDPATKSYGGRQYTYKTELELKPFEKILCPTPKGTKKALVVEVNLPESSIDPAWKDRIKEIKEVDTN